MTSGQASDTSQDMSVPIRDIIFSCGICQASLADVYATKDHNKGFHSGSGDEDGLVAKFWIGACCHTFCAKHLEGGGLPFHSQNALPRATCPVCVLKGIGNKQQDLFAIRGLSPGQYDEAIPRDFLECPPLDLSGDDPKLHAMRFQYHQLYHYSQVVTKHWKSAERKRRTVENALSKERKHWRTTEAGMKHRIATLEKCEQKLQNWEQRRDMINHYLGLVNKMAQDIKFLRTKLRELGFAVPDKNYAFQPASTKPPRHDAHNSSHNSSATLGKIKVLDFCQTANQRAVAHQTRSSSTSRKRKQPVEDQYVDALYQEADTQVQHEETCGIVLAPALVRSNQSQQSYSPAAPAPSSSTAWLQPQHRENVQQVLSHAPFAEMNSRLASHCTQHRQPTYSRNSVTFGDSGSHSAINQEMSGQEHQQYQAHHEHRSLPIRQLQRMEQSQSVRGRAQQQQSYTVPDQPYLAQKDTLPQQKGLLSMPPRRRSGQNLYANAANIDEEPPPQSRAQMQPPSRNMHLDSTCGLQASQSVNQTPEQLQSLRSQVSQRKALAPSSAVQGSNQSTPSQRQPCEPLSASVASPFFWKPFRQLSSDMPEEARPQSTTYPPRQGLSSRGHVHNTTPHSSLSALQRRGPCSRSGMVALHNFENQRSFRGRTLQQLSNTSMPRELVRTLQTPRSQQPPFAHSGNQPMVAPGSRPSSHAYRLSPGMSRSRVTLSPSNFRSPYGSSQDPALAMIQGVKGGSTLKTEASRQGYTPAYTPSRTLLPAAGSRRAVQR